MSLYELVHYSIVERSIDFAPASIFLQQYKMLNLSLPIDEQLSSLAVYSAIFFSWEPALETLNSQDEEAEVKKNHCNFQLYTVTFEPRHENKSCSACPEDQLKPFQFLAGNQLYEL